MTIKNDELLVKLVRTLNLKQWKLLHRYLRKEPDVRCDVFEEHYGGYVWCSEYRRTRFFRTRNFDFDNDIPF